MPNYGSSRIKALILSATGGTGPVGNTGPTGNTGAYVTGPAGANGVGIHGISYSSSNRDTIYFILSDETQIGITGIYGNTGIGPVTAPKIEYIGSGVTALTNLVGQGSGFTLSFRTLSLSSGLSGSVIGNTIKIETDYSATGSFDLNKLLYVDFSSISNQYYLDSADHADYYEYVYSGITYSFFEFTSQSSRDILNGDNFNYSSSLSQSQSHYGLTMTIDAAFYGMTGTENSLTGSAWFPYLKYRASYFDINDSSGVTIGNINFSPLGPYTKKISFNEPIGSCCFCSDCISNPISGRSCVDYVSKTYCQSILGRWSESSCASRLNSYDCYLRRACCVNGKCINTSYQKCMQMHGIFSENNECGASYDCERGFFGVAAAITPYLATEEKFCCCVNGRSFPDMTIQECSQMNGILSLGLSDCRDTDCCTENFRKGACCLPNGECVYVTPQQCSGLFKGIGITCNPNPCCIGST